MLNIKTLKIALVASLGLAPISKAQYPGVQGTVERQIHLLEQKKQFAEGQISEAEKADSEMDFEKAYAFFKSAVDNLPQGGAATAVVRSKALDGFCETAIKLSKQRVSEGRYADARTIVEVILEPSYNPNYAPALNLRFQLLNPNSFVDRGTLTPDYVDKVGTVQELIKEGEGYFSTGRYDIAFKRCEQALNIDKYNIAARRLMERINDARQKYAETARNEVRGDMLMKIQKAWELPVRNFKKGPSSIVEQPEIPMDFNTKPIENKLDTIRIPKLELTESTIAEALQFIRKRASELDATETNPTKKGINIVLLLPKDSPERSYPITIAVNDYPLRQVLKAISDLVGLKIKIEPNAVLVVPQSSNTEKLLTREYRVPPGFISSSPSSAPQARTDGQQGAGTSRAMAYLMDKGVEFPKGATASLAASTRLIVTNTQQNLDQVEAIVENAGNNQVPQVEIEAKFIEISQNNLDELGFDWLLGQFALAGGSGVYGGGGTMGFDRKINNNSYPLLNPGDTPLPVGASSSTSGPVTAGNRGGSGFQGYSTAIQMNAIDAVLLGSQAGVAPGVLSIAGVFTNPQFQVVLRALSQKKGIDLVSAPKVTTQSQQRASIEIIRDFRYPKEFNPPQLSGATGSTYTPVVPNSPSDWETKHTGITLEVEPTVGSDNYTIDLLLEPRVIEFEGFINYGSPIYASVARPLSLQLPGPIQYGKSFEFEATPNIINQPIFSTREISTQVSVYDGQTVVLGGLMREDVQKVQDKVPILGDIPLAGRLFRSNVDQHIKRNLLIFVTTSLMDPAGERVIKPQEEEDAHDAETNKSEIIDDSLASDIISPQIPE